MFIALLFLVIAIGCLGIIMRSYNTASKGDGNPADDFEIIEKTEA